MRLKNILAILFVLALPAAAGAQTKFSGTEQCGKPDPQHMLQVGDRPNHAIGIQQMKCTWPKPFEMEGVQIKESINTAFNDASGNTSRTRGYDVGTMANGDRQHVRYQGTGTLKEGALQSGEGTWSFIAGTGKFKGIKGKGTWKCKPAGEGMTCEIEGEYQLPK